MMPFCTAHQPPRQHRPQPAPIPNAHRRERRRAAPKPLGPHRFTDWASI